MVEINANLEEWESCALVMSFSFFFFFIFFFFFLNSFKIFPLNLGLLMYPNSLSTYECTCPKASSSTQQFHQKNHQAVQL